MTTATFSPAHTLGRTGPTVSALGVGTWALGGPFTFDGRAAGWGEADDDVSVRALHAAIDHGVRLIDTAGVYGTGHSERVVGRALAKLPTGIRDTVVVATKFGLVFDETSRSGSGSDLTPATIRRQATESLQRLGRDRVDVLQLHGGAEGATDAEDVVAVLEGLVAEGTIGWFGTSQDEPAIIEVFARSAHCVSLQSQVNVFGWSSEVLGLAREHGLTMLARSPLAMGLLGGRYSRGRRPAPGDVRLDTPWWTYFDDDAIEEWLRRLDVVRELLTVDVRSLIQGALGYLWSVDDRIVPLPGVRTVEQAVENSSALALGPLPRDTAAEITRLLADSPDHR